LSALTTIVGFVTPEEEGALDAATAIAIAGMTVSKMRSLQRVRETAVRLRFSIVAGSSSFQG
jgi:uncharacterized protein YfiM (DUF2279 family)